MTITLFHNIYNINYLNHNYLNHNYLDFPNLNELPYITTCNNNNIFSEIIYCRKEKHMIQDILHVFEH